MFKSGYAVLLSCLFFTTAHAYEASDQSSLTVQLPAEWKLSRTQDEAGVAKLSEYINTRDNSKQVLLVTTLVKPDFNPTPGPDKFAAKLYVSTKDLMEKNHCSFEDIKNLGIKGTDNEWGIFWGCSKTHLTGFMVFVNGDAKTMYTFTFKTLESYPLTEARRKEMTAILKDLQICYKTKTCSSLIH